MHFYSLFIQSAYIVLNRQVDYNNLNKFLYVTINDSLNAIITDI